ncbi:hypothetical protein MMC26_005988 [Xylographa opegraphella]|nr:hypothetical protein [Xylographa opegraphella]
MSQLLGGKTTQTTNTSPFTSADRINQLNDIDRDVTKLLHSAGLAIKALTGRTSLDAVEKSTSVEQQKSSFTAATSQYFSMLSSIDVRLRRQVYALEEANIIPAESATKESQGDHGVPGNPSQTSKERASTQSSGLGNLDIGWLNSRNDKVGKQMEAELWEQARDLVEEIRTAGFASTGQSDPDIDMDRRGSKDGMTDLS